MTALFIGHGSPMNAIEDNQYTRTWSVLAKQMGRPKAIIVISAHWVTAGTAVTAMERPKTIHDFYGFPEALNRMEYPAPGNPLLAEHIKQLVKTTSVHLDHAWGLDHGAWSFLVHMYPEADIPVLQLSIDPSLSPEQMMAIGKELSKIDALLIGAGNIVHNLRMMGQRTYPWAVEFEQFVKKALQEHPAQLAQYKEHPAAKLAADEHFLPLLYVIGAGKGQPEFFNEGIDLGSMSMMCVAFGL
jgi:4,5-DOPA dioxygenase extradiol